MASDHVAVSRALLAQSICLLRVNRMYIVVVSYGVGQSTRRGRRTAETLAHSDSAVVSSSGSLPKRLSIISLVKIGLSMRGPGLR